MGAQPDVLIAGASLGGVSAALAAARHGLRVLLLAEGDWIGGQLTSQGVPPDEHGWIEEYGCTATYRDLRRRIRDHYRSHYPLTAAARAMEHLNPGNGWVSPLCHEPAVAHGILRQLVQDTAIEVWHHATVTSADVDRDRVRHVTVNHAGASETVSARWFVDATELGALLPLTGAEHETGSPDRPANAQALSWCFAMEHYAGEDHRIPRPERYAYWRDFTPKLMPPWPGKLLDWVTPNPRTMVAKPYRFAPHDEAPKAFSGLWSYRRLLDRSLFEPGFRRSDICLVNWPLIDYLDSDLCTATLPDRERALAEAREMSLCVFYWLQNDAPRPDGGTGWPGLRLAGEALGTLDGLAKEPYIRESRRIRALRTIAEEDVSAAMRPGCKFAEPYPDSVGVGSYRIDLHPTVGGDNYVDVESLPFRIPLGSLIPVRLRNLLPACKNIGTTHVTNGCYRLHPVEWNIGEAAGLLTAYCAQQETEPHAVAENYAPFQAFLRSEGVQIEWPAELDLSKGDPHRHAW